MKNNEQFIKIQYWSLKISKKVQSQGWGYKVSLRVRDNFHPKICITKMKNYLIKFLNSNLFYESYSILYPKQISFPFKNEKDAENFINNYFHFIPIFCEKTNGVTDKFTLETYIFLKRKKIEEFPVNILDESKELLLSALYTGLLTKTCYHEINHNMYNIYYYHSNGSIPLKTPRKLINLRESGRELEILLFGNIVIKLNLKQIKYILNENNLTKGIAEFNEGYKLLKNEDLDIKGEFEYFNELGNYINLPTTISGDYSDNIPTIYGYDNNDIMGFYEEEEFIPYYEWISHPNLE